VNQVQVRSIEIKDGIIRWMFRCSTCAEITIRDQDLIDFLILKKFPIKPKECFDCTRKNTFEIDFEGSFIMAKSDLGA